MKKLIQSFLGKFGYKLSKTKPLLSDAGWGMSPYSPYDLKSNPIIDLQKVEDIGWAVPGMISPYSGGHLFSLCYFQELEGDVVEIGSWQGRSTAFFAHAVKDSGNGQVYAVDHFKGNVGKEHFYVMGAEDLSDLKQGFVNNMEKVGVSEHVTLLDMPNVEAVKHIKDKSVRFLFIDGDHTKEGISKDIELFFPKLKAGAIVAFDDFSTGFPGVMEVVDNLLQENKHVRVMTYSNTLVLKFGHDA